MTMIEDDWAEKAARMTASMLVEAARKRIDQAEAEREAALAALQDARLGACRMDAPDGPECWCGRPSSYQSGECDYHGDQALRANRCEAAERERDEAVVAKRMAEQRLEAAEERGRLIGEWNGVLVHTDGMAALLDRMAPNASPEALRREAAAQRAHAAQLRARPPRPSSFTESAELRELRRAEAEAAVAVLRHRESHPQDRDGYMRLHVLWLNAAARVNAMELRLYERP